MWFNSIIICNPGLEKIGTLFSNPYKTNLLVHTSLDLNLQQQLHVLKMHKLLFHDSYLGINGVNKKYYPNGSYNLINHAHIVLMNEHIIKEYNTLISWLLTTTPNNLYGSYIELTPQNFNGGNLIQYRSGHIFMSPQDFFKWEQQKTEYIKYLEIYRRPIYGSLLKSIEYQSLLLETILNEKNI